MRTFLLTAILLVCLCNIVFAISISIDRTGVEVAQKKIIAAARTYLGKPYAWGGTGPDGFDCSGLVFRVFSDVVHYSLPRNVDSLMKEGMRAKGDLSASDLVFFDTSGKGKPTHVGIYIKDNTFIHSASAGRKQGIIISSLTEKYYKTRYLGARRLIKTGFPLVKIEINDKKRKVVAFPAGLSPGIPIYLTVTSTLKKAITVKFTAYRNKKAMLFKRVRVSRKKKSSALWFIPDEGKWAVVLKTPEDEKLAVIRFY